MKLFSKVQIILSICILMTILTGCQPGALKPTNTPQLKKTSDVLSSNTNLTETALSSAIEMPSAVTPKETSVATVLPVTTEVSEMTARILTEDELSKFFLISPSNKRPNIARI